MRHLLERVVEAYWRYLYLAYGNAKHFLVGKGLGRLQGITAFLTKLEHALAPKGPILIRCHGHKLYVNLDDHYVAPALLWGSMKELKRSFSNEH